MRRQGAVPGVSNYAAWQTQAALGIQERYGWARLQAIQPMYNLVKRQAEVELLPMAAANSCPSFRTAWRRAACSPASTSSQTGRLTTNKMYQARYAETWAPETAASCLLPSHNFHPMSAAVAWVDRIPR